MVRVLGIFALFGELGCRLWCVQIDITSARTKKEECGKTYRDDKYESEKEMVE